MAETLHQLIGSSSVFLQYYPIIMIIYKVLYIPGGAGFLPSTVNSIIYFGIDSSREPTMTMERVRSFATRIRLPGSRLVADVVCFNGSLHSLERAMQWQRMLDVLDFMAQAGWWWGKWKRTGQQQRVNAQKTGFFWQYWENLQGYNMVSMKGTHDLFKGV